MARRVSRAHAGAVIERAILVHFPDLQDGRSVLKLDLRSNLDVDPRPLWGLRYALLIEVPHFVMERKMMLGIKDRAARAQ